MEKPRRFRGFRSSIAFKLFASFLLCIVLLLLFNWLLNTFALGSYYRREKQQKLETSFRQVDTLLLDGTGDAALQTTSAALESLANNDGISSTIWFGSFMLDCRVRGRNEYIPNPPTLNYTAGTYVVTVETDTRLGTDFLTLSGRLSGGYIVVMRTPVEAITESVGITNQFLLLSGAATLVAALILVFFFTQNFTRPIRELSRVAGSVARLDFGDRYTGRGSDELAELGHSINSMSASLEHTISELKSANLRLLADIEQRDRQDAARRAFIANVSHELKTPIALIGTYAEGLREDIADSAEGREYYCTVIEDEAKKMSELIRRMTMLTQLEAGGEQAEVERFDIRELLHNLLQKNRPLFAQKDVTLCEPEDEPVFVWADPYLIEHVLSNYLSNALHHVSPGGRVEARIIPKDNGRVRVTIFNTGTHIPEEDLPRIWDSFYKVDKARTRAYGGSGLGLSVVAAIMNAHRMPYGVYNCIGEDRCGVEFFIELESR